jgi:diguanylate cyclase (GGDEF)-like protein
VAFAIAIAALVAGLLRTRRQARLLRLAVEAEEAAYRRMKVLLSVTEAVNSSLALEEVLKHALTHAGRLIGAPAAALYLVRQDGVEMTRESSYGLSSRARAGTRSADAEPIKGALAGHRLASRPLPETSAPGLEHGGHAQYVLVVPVRHGGQLLAAMELYPVNDVQLSHDLIELLHGVAAQAATAIRHAQIYRQQEQSALTDELTQLPNRRYLTQRFGQEVQRAKRHKKPIAFLMIDVDEFKPVNDTHGHLAGDRVLSELGAILAGSLRGSDVCARYGGDEFGAIVHEATIEGASVLAERLRQAVERARFSSGVKVTVSVGVAATDDPDRMDRLVEAADRALYEAKDRGRNRVAIAELGPVGARA